MDSRKQRCVPTLDMLDSIRSYQKILLLDKKKRIILPRLHVLYFRQRGGDNQEGIGAACLEFSFFAWGPDRESAQECLDGLVDSYFRQRITNNEIEEIRQDLADDFMDPYWALYRQYSIFQAASRERSLYTALLQELRTAEVKEKDLRKKLTDAENAIEALLKENALPKTICSSRPQDISTFAQWLHRNQSANLKGIRP